MSDSKTPPLKRHAALLPLSRDHYVGLVQGRHLVQAADAGDVDRRAAVAAFLDAWDTDIAVHFDDEERLLAPLASEGGRARLQSEHANIRQMTEQLREQRRKIDPDAEHLRKLGLALTLHIRWEERELFPAIEAAAGEDLERLQPHTDRIEASRHRGRGKSSQA